MRPLRGMARLPIGFATGHAHRQRDRSTTKADELICATLNTYETRKKALRYIAKVQVLTLAFEGEGCS
jgi:hypothetical protein